MIKSVSKRAVACMAAAILGLQVGTALAQKRVEWSTALERCQGTLRTAARDPETAKIPVVYPMQGGADWRFLWAAHTKLVRMRNGLGAEVAVGALCVVDEDTGKIKLLTLDGKQLITPSGK